MKKERGNDFALSQLCSKFVDVEEKILQFETEQDHEIALLHNGISGSFFEVGVFIVGNCLDNTSIVDK